MASGESRAILEKLLPSRSLSLLCWSTLISRPARLSHTQPAGLGSPGVKGSDPVDPSFSLSLLVSAQRTRAMPLHEPFQLFLVRGRNICSLLLFEFNAFHTRLWDVQRRKLTASVRCCYCRCRPQVRLEQSQGLRTLLCRICRPSLALFPRHVAAVTGLWHPISNWRRQLLLQDTHVLPSRDVPMLSRSLWLQVHVLPPPRAWFARELAPELVPKGYFPGQKTLLTPQTSRIPHCPPRSSSVFEMCNPLLQIKSRNQVHLDIRFRSVSVCLVRSFSGNLSRKFSRHVLVYRKDRISG